MGKIGCAVAAAVVAVILLAGCGGGGGAGTVTTPAASSFAGNYTASVATTGASDPPFSWGFSVTPSGAVTSGDIPEGVGTTVTGSITSAGEITIQIAFPGQPSVTIRGTIQNAGGLLGGSGTWTDSDGTSGTWTCKAGLDTSAIAGNYSGTYTGDKGGTFTVSVAADGRVTGQGVSPSVGNFSITGTLWPGGTLSLTGSGSVAAGPWTVTWHGNVSDGGSGGGTWRSSSGYSGTWIMHK